MASSSARGRTSLGSANSSNTVALEKLALESGCPIVCRINAVAELPTDILRDARVVGVTAGASAPDELVTAVVDRLDPTDGVEVVLGDAIPAGEFGARLSTTDLEDLEDAHRTTYSDASTRTAAMFVLYVHGHSNLDSVSGNVIGLSKM